MRGAARSTLRSEIGHDSGKKMKINPLPHMFVVKDLVTVCGVVRPPIHVLITTVCAGSVALLCPVRQH